MRFKEHILLKSIIFLTSIIFVITFLLSFFYSNTINQSKNKIDFSSGNNIHFATVLIGNETQFLEKIQKGIQNEADISHMDIEFFNVKTVEEGTETIKMLITAGVDGIITQGINEAAFMEALRTAKHASIPLVLVYSDEQTVERDLFIGINPFDMGIEAATLYQKSEPEIGKVVFITQTPVGSSEDTTSKLQMLGFMDVFENLHRLSQVIVKKSEPTLLSAEGIVAEIFLGESDIAGIVCTNEVDTVGVTQVVIDLNKVGRVNVIGTGLTPQIADYIDKGIIYGTLYRNPEKMGHMALRSLADILNQTFKKGEQADYIDLPIEVITKENLETYMKIEAVK
ncbi:sugar ABC transporter substrate-binding protein [Fusibacter ferrireducens]|uniref:Substrate-binding domain-containing protein n=1 Tax=Fusibacter ferrireducens TaxID=2785058 RepID=A0ABR9ZX74_9FIRM|nr:substrate-binding domain-containing protein [Fusibacter ferrireducens]MBF4695063.1 substrate-binding domain-containing protein [Fusibacter ferrireducens]